MSKLRLYRMVAMLAVGIVTTAICFAALAWGDLDKLNPITIITGGTNKVLDKAKDILEGGADAVNAAVPGELKFNRDDLKVNRHDIVPSKLEWSRHDVQAVFKPIASAAGDVGTEAWHAAGEVVRPVAREVRSAGREAERFAKKIEAEAKRTGSHTEDLVKATGYYVDGSFRDYRDMYVRAAREALDGKLLDAAWHLTAEPYRSTDKRMAQAVTQSTYANAIASAYASMAGPAGAAAYSAWYTYKVTGDKDLALRAGILVGATSGTLNYVADVPVRPDSKVTDMTMKAVTAGAVSGAAVAAAGGNEQAVRRAFLLGGVSLAIRDGYNEFTGRDFSKDQFAPSERGYCARTPKRPDGTPECGLEPQFYKRGPDGEILRRPSIDGKPGEPIPDYPSVSGNRVWAGLAAAEGETGLFYENSPLMFALAQTPYVNATGFSHDPFVVMFDLDGYMVQATIPPFLALSHYASLVPIQSTVTKEVIKSKQQHRQDQNRLPLINTIGEFGLWLAALITPEPVPAASEASRAKIGAAAPREDEGDSELSYFCVKDARLVPGAEFAHSKRVALATRSIFLATNEANPTQCAIIVQGKQEADSDIIAYRSSQFQGCALAAYALANEAVSQGWECLVKDQKSESPAMKSIKEIANAIRSAALSL